MKQFQIKLLFINFISLSLISLPSIAYEEILTPYKSARALGMGGATISTGLYEDNFFGNPARMTQIPETRVDLFHWLVETNDETLGNVSSILDFAGGDTNLANITDIAGRNSHVRFQMGFPGFYLPRIGDGPWTFAWGTFLNTQIGAALRQSNRLEPIGIAEIGTHFNLSRTFLPDNSLSIGINWHNRFKGGIDTSIGLVDVFQGLSFDSDSIFGYGVNIDGSLGAFYTLPFHPDMWDFDIGLSINNIVSKTIQLKQPEINSSILDAPRSVNIGFTAYRLEAGPFMEPVISIEFLNIGQSNGGSFFRHLHIGGEIDWSVLRFRTGFYQGYITAGIGLETSAFQLNLATYGEELSLNTGGRQDRRFVAQLGFSI